MQQSNGKPLVFVDTNVLASYFRGESSSSRLFSPEMMKKLRLAINPIVLQEVLFLSEVHQHPEILDEVQQEVSVLPLNLEKAEEYLQKNVRTLRNYLVHSNDVLILSSAADCDYLVTYDQKLQATVESLAQEKPQIVTPEQLISQIESRV